MPDKMTKKNCFYRSRAEEQYAQNNEPRLIGEIIAQMKKDGVEPFGKGYNVWQAEEQQKGGEE